MFPLPSSPQWLHRAEELFNSVLSRLLMNQHAEELFNSVLSRLLTSQHVLSTRRTLP